MTAWPRVALDRLGEGGPLAMVTILAIEGSAPREPGTRMLVWDGGQWGTIGGGNLEHQATLQARRMLSADPTPAYAVQDYPLGPFLAQCCGGRVRLLVEPLTKTDAPWLREAKRLCGAGRPFERRVRLTNDAAERSVAPAAAGSALAAATIDGEPILARGPKPGPGDALIEQVAAAAPRLRLFGAGHVGQALARALAPLPFRLEWYDSRPEIAAETGARLASPEALRWIAADPAPYTLVLTHDHALDYALVLATLGGGEDGYLGLIGSRTKRARFARRLREDGVDEATLARLTCPIGLAGLTGKAPEIIAVAVAADLLLRLQRRAVTPRPAPEMTRASL